MREKIWVIAGSQAEYADYVIAKKSNTTFKYVYVADVMYLRGTVNPHGVFIGTWKNRADILDIIHQLQISSSTRNPVLDKLRNEIEWQPYMGFKPSKVLIKGKGTWEIFDTNPLQYEDRIADAASMLAKEIDKEALRQVMNNGI